MSRTIKFAQAGGPEVLEFIEIEVPAPGPHEICIKVKAIGINRAELNVAQRQICRIPDICGRPRI